MPKDGHIRLLPLHIANKIAAGEVVERPASVVKELVENALDAGAGRIEISVTAGGRNLISVRDDGCGMTRADALLSLERQATSKIRDVDDILEIGTLGFRGEAIPSIAAVSRFTLVTRRADEEAATRLQVNAGTLAEVRETGAPPGTSVEVRDLFCNVPARRKFLRAYATEEAAVRHAFTVIALSRPETGFSLFCDGREVARLPKGDTMEDRIRELFGADFAASLVPVSGQSGPVSVSGYVERPDRALPVRRDQFVFVNSRPAGSPVIAAALRDAMPRADQRLRSGAFLFISLPCRQVDVNVHPAKREVRFHRPADVRAALLKAIGDALLGCGAAPARTAVAVPPAPSPAQAGAAPLPSAPSPAPAPVSAPPPAPQHFVAPFSSMPGAGVGIPPAHAPVPAPPPAPQSAQVQAAEAPRQRPGTRFLAQMENGYLLFETADGLVAVSPRAARERILYERLVGRSGKMPSQPLLVPEIVRLPPAESLRIRSNIDVAEELGFSIEEFGQNTWKVDALPLAGEGFDVREMLSSIAADLAEGRSRRDGGRWREETAARACARVCAGRRIPYTPASAERLMADLSACRMPYGSPDGAPTMILVSNREMERRFAK